MSIKSIEIKNFKSIDNLTINISQLNSFIGKNGVGKSTILKAIQYFYANLIDLKASNKYFDTVNTFKNELSISIKYDISRIYDLSTENFKKKLFIMLRKNKISKKNKIIEVKMIQNKNEEINWNINYDERYIIFNTHPIYFCDTRSLSLTNWDSIWDVVGDLVNAKDANEIEKSLFSSLKEDSFKKFDSYSKIFEKFLNMNSLSFGETSRKERIISLLQLQLGGKEFINKAEELDYYSDGTNSHNYLNFLIYIAYEISQKRLKDVTVLLDEPELGLHPSMIDTLMEKIVDYSKTVNFMIFSHSPRLLSFILRNRGMLYKLYLKDKYTEIAQIVKSEENNHKLLISENEASFLFADYLLFVEGITEVELFRNTVITNLFPFMKKIDIVNTNSNDHILKVLLPNKNKSKIPYLILVDLDKIIKFKSCNNSSNVKFSIKQNWYSPFSKDEKFKKKNIYTYSKNESKKNLYILKKIKEYKEKNYDLDRNLGIVKDFNKVYDDIKDICLANNLYTVRTTIEGTLINEQSLEYIRDWKEKRFENISKEEELILFRLLFNGKTDSLFDKNDINLLSKYNINCTIPKNSNWINEFFEYYNNVVLQQKQYANDKNNNKKKSKFAEDFPELYDIIKTIENRFIVSS